MIEISQHLIVHLDMKKGRTVEKSLPITKARDQLSALPERLSAEAVAVAVTRRGEPVLETFRGISMNL